MAIISLGIIERLVFVMETAFSLLNYDYFLNRSINLYVFMLPNVKISCIPVPALTYIFIRAVHKLFSFQNPPPTQKMKYFHLTLNIP
jgi:hypothetical protein